MKPRYIAVVLVIGVVLLGLASSPSAWAATGQHQGGCGGTVPCRTPTPIHKGEKDKDTPTPAPTFDVMLTPSLLPQTLPASGSKLPAFPLVMMAIGAFLVYAGWIARRASFV
jgi:hypothetical protein